MLKKQKQLFLKILVTYVKYIAENWMFIIRQNFIQDGKALLQDLIELWGEKKKKERAH